VHLRFSFPLKKKKKKKKGGGESSDEVSFNRPLFSFLPLFFDDDFSESCIFFFMG
jgi:hypothetical protein